MFLCRSKKNNTFGWKHWSIKIYETSLQILAFTDLLLIIYIVQYTGGQHMPWSAGTDMQ